MFYQKCIIELSNEDIKRWTKGADESKHSSAQLNKFLFSSL